MRKYLNLTKRNCLVFLRDRTSVFFALMSMLIVLLLQAVFLGDMNVESVLNLIKEYGGEMRDAAADEANARQLIQYWTLAGILVVNAVTVTLSVIGTMIEDAVNRACELIEELGAGEVVGGIHGRNRLMGNSLLDIIVFGRSAGQSAAKAAKEAKPAKLTLAHIEKFAQELDSAGVFTDTVSPKLLPNYTMQNNI